MNIDLFLYLFDDDAQEEVKSAVETPQEIPKEEDVDLYKQQKLLQQQMEEQEEYTLAMQPLLDLENDEEFRSRSKDVSFSEANFTKGNPFTTPALSLNPDSYLAAIYGNEGGTTGVDLENVKGTASGKYALTEATRKDMFNKYYKNQMDYSEFSKKYNTNPYFEYQVARNLATEKIYSSKTAAEAFGSWYHPQGAKQGQFGMVPNPEYGNKLTIGQYALNAYKNYK
jgi:hypothetical protein